MRPNAFPVQLRVTQRRQSSKKDSGVCMADLTPTRPIFCENSTFDEAFSSYGCVLDSRGFVTAFALNMNEVRYKIIEAARSTLSATNSSERSGIPVARLL
jgi:hypothetical protein